MRVTLSAAMTIDGFLDDTRGERLVLSSGEDRAGIERLRAESDAILVGAGTVRVDNPSLVTRGEAFFAQRRRLGKPPHPIKVTLTRTGRLDPESRFFTSGDGPKLVFCAASPSADIEARLAGRAEVIRANSDPVPASFVIGELSRRGVRQLLIEGGTQVLTLFLQSGEVHRLRLAIAPVVLGRLGKARLLDAVDFSGLGQGAMALGSVEQLGSTAVLWFDIARA